MFCENCQHQVSDAASFCPACGHPQVPVSSPPPQPAPQQRYSAYAPPATNAPTVAAKTNGMAVASLVLGIVWVFGITSILALIFGILSKRQIETSNGAQTGRGLSIAGIVLGAVGIAGLIFWIVVAIVAAHTCDPNVQVC